MSSGQSLLVLSLLTPQSTGCTFQKKNVPKFLVCYSQIGEQYTAAGPYISLPRKVQEHCIESGEKVVDVKRSECLIIMHNQWIQFGHNAPPGISDVLSEEALSKSWH